MKRLALMMAAVACVAAPLAAPAFARDDQGRRAERAERGGGQDRGDRGGRRYDDDRGRGRGDDRGRPPRGDDGRGRAPVLGYGDERPRYTPQPRYEPRPRDDDRRRDDAPRAQGFAPAPPAARRGGYLPRNFSGEIVDDYRRYRLRTPPAGFAWVRMGRGFALVSMRDGQIFDVVQ